MNCVDCTIVELARRWGVSTANDRGLLNYAAVFLGELLSALEPDTPAFAAAYQSRSCVALPRTDQLPCALQYAATANVLLAEFKLIDHIADSGHMAQPGDVEVVKVKKNRGVDGWELYSAVFAWTILNSLVTELTSLTSKCWAIFPLAIATIVIPWISGTVSFPISTYL